jgi:signal transduction histidine kinase
MVTTMDAQRRAADRWMPALHNLYLATLLISWIATLTVEPIAALWSVEARTVSTGLATLVLATADLAVRRRLTYRRGLTIGYFLGLSGVLGVLTSVCPFYTNVAFGALPLAFVSMSPLVATAAGLALTGSPLVVQPLVSQYLFADRAPFGVAYRADYLYLAVVSIALPMLIGILTARAIQDLHRQGQARQALVEQLSATRAELAAASRMAGRVEERQRLAHELHDTLTQGLSGVIMQLEAAEQDLDADRPSPQRLARRLARARETARSCLGDTRRAVEALRPEQLDDRTLVQAIIDQCHQWSERTGTAVRPVLSGSTRRLPSLVEVTALRVVQESLANASKHAAAEEILVTINYGDDRLCLTIRDDGCGFDPASARGRPDGFASGGLGLPTMRERVESVGGRLTVTSSPGAGTQVDAELPEVSG